MLNTEMLEHADRVRAAVERERAERPLRRKLERVEAKIAAGHGHLVPARDALSARLNGASS